MSNKWNAIEGNWEQFKGAVQKQWGELTHDELQTIAGKKAALLGALQKKYGYTTQAAEEQVEKFVNTVDIRKYDSHASTN